MDLPLEWRPHNVIRGMRIWQLLIGVTAGRPGLVVGLEIRSRRTPSLGIAGRVLRPAAPVRWAFSQIPSLGLAGTSSPELPESAAGPVVSSGLTVWS